MIYETLILTVPEITKEEIAKLESQINKEIKDAKSSLISFERWGKYKLAYPVRNNEYGVYFLLRFEILNEVVDLLSRIKNLLEIKNHEIVMRYIMSKFSNRSLEYQRPRSLEDNPEDVDTFIRKNKMEGILASASNYTKKPKDFENEEDVQDNLEGK